MTTKGGSSGGSSSGSSNDKDKERVWEVNPTQNLTGSFGGGGSSIDRAPPTAHGGKSGDDGKSIINIQPVNTSIADGMGSTPEAHLGSDGGGFGGEGRLGTTVEQKPTPGKSDPIPTPAGDGSENTTVTNGPRSDFSVVLAGQTGKRPDRNPARSNNFISLVGGAGGLGRKTSAAKRSLIGGA